MGKEYASGVYALHLGPNYFASTISWPGLDLWLIKDELEGNVGKLNMSLYRLRERPTQHFELFGYFGEANPIQTLQRMYLLPIIGGWLQPQSFFRRYGTKSSWF
jgi:hypothetical protein